MYLKLSCEIDDKKIPKWGTNFQGKYCLMQGTVQQRILPIRKIKPGESITRDPEGHTRLGVFSNEH